MNGFIKVFFAAIIAVTVLFSISSAQADGQVVAILKGMQKQLQPGTKVDTNTTVKSTSLSGNTLTSVYELNTNVSLKDMPKEQIAAFSTIKVNLCKHPVLQKLYSMGATLSYIYQNTKGEVLHRVSANKKACA